MYFVESGIAMEKDPQISMSSYTMFAETVELLKYEPTFIINYLHYWLFVIISLQSYVCRAGSTALLWSQTLKCFLYF